MTDYGYYKFSLAEKMRILSMGYASIFIVSMLFYKNFIVSFVLGFACIALLKPVSRYKAEKRREFSTFRYNRYTYAAYHTTDHATMITPTYGTIGTFFNHDHIDDNQWSSMTIETIITH